MSNWNDINKEEFVRRLKSNDGDAFAELYSVLIKDLTSFLVKQFKNVNLSDVDAEEIADDAMLKISNSISDFNPKKGAKLTTWIFDIAKNKAIDFLRTRKSDKAIAISNYLQQEFELNAETEKFQIKNPDMVLSTAISKSPTKNFEDIIIQKAFYSLKETDQDIIRMRRVMEYEDIAKVENKTINALSTQYARALERFEKIYFYIKRSTKMDNKSLEELLDNLFISEASPPLTDAVVDAYLISCDEHRLEDVQNLRIRFVKKALANLYKNPVKKISEQISFGSWIKETRKKAHLSQKDISMSVLKDESYINDIENSYTFPWQSNTENIAKLIILFRIHFDALTDLLHTSFAICKNQDKLGISARTGKNENKSKAQDAIRKALEIHLSNKEDLELNDEIRNFLDSLKDELKDRDAVNLII